MLVKYVCVILCMKYNSVDSEDDKSFCFLILFLCQERQPMFICPLFFLCCFTFSNVLLSLLFYFLCCFTFSTVLLSLMFYFLCCFTFSAVLLSLLFYYLCCFTFSAVLLSLLFYFLCCFTFSAVLLSLLFYYLCCFTFSAVLLSLLFYYLCCSLCLFYVFCFASSCDCIVAKTQIYHKIFFGAFLNYLHGSNCEGSVTFMS